MTCRHCAEDRRSEHEVVAALGGIRPAPEDGEHWRKRFAALAGQPDTASWQQLHKDVAGLVAAGRPVTKRRTTREALLESSVSFKPTGNRGTVADLMLEVGSVELYFVFDVFGELAEVHHDYLPSLDSNEELEELAESRTQLARLRAKLTGLRLQAQALEEAAAEMRRALGEGDAT